MKRTLTLTSRQGQTISIEHEGGRITGITNLTGYHFPFVVGQTFNRTIEVWATNHNLLVDGKDLSKPDKIFGIRIKDVPEGHPLRFVYPSKFR